MAEEVDEILLLSLRGLQCQIPDNVVSVRDLDANMIVEATSACLRAINAESYGEVPRSIPKNVSLRFKACQELAGAVKHCGYTGQLGYNDFLYPDEKGTRALLTYLVENLPTEDLDKSGQTLSDPAGALRGAIASRLRANAARPWLRCASYATRDFRSAPLCLPTTCGGKRGTYFASASHPHVAGQVRRPATLSASLVEHMCRAAANRAAETAQDADDLSTAASKGDKLRTMHHRAAKALQGSHGASSGAAESARSADAQLADLLDILAADAGADDARGGSAFTRGRAFKQEAGDDAVVVTAESEADAAAEKESERERQERELAELQARIDALREETDRFARERDAAVAGMQQARYALSLADASSGDLERENRIRKQAVELLSDPEGNERSLREISAASSERLATLASEWEKRRKPLIDEVRRLRGLAQSRTEAARGKLEAARALRKSLKSMIQDIREREDMAKKLSDHVDRMKQVDRGVYTRKIMDIIRNIHKQSSEVQRINRDIRDVLKSIQKDTEVSQRSFGAAEELVYRFTEDSATGKEAKQSYKLVTMLDEHFQSLIRRTEERHQAFLKCRELEKNIEDADEKILNSNMDKLVADLEQIKEENARLQAQVKAQR